jgi:type IV pilus assembly protein PilM
VEAARQPVNLLRSGATVGVDLGRRAIKVVVIRWGSPPRLVYAARHGTPDGAVEGGVIRNAAALSAALREALRGAGVTGARGVLGIQGRTALVRTFLVPPMPKDELKTAVRWEAERQLPLRIEEAVLDAQVVRHVTEDGQPRLEVLMAAVPERDALSYYQVANDAGLDVAALEVSSLALARALTSDDKALTAAIDVGSDATETVIAHPALPPVCRTLPVGGDDLALPPTSPTTPGWKDLLEGVARSFEYFQAQARVGKIERVVVTGEGAVVSAVARVLAVELDVPVSIGDPLSRVTIAPNVNGDLREQPATFAVAVGLALRTIP